MNRIPSAYACPVVPIMVIALSCVAMTEMPAAHQGMLRLARKYPSISLLCFVRFRPSYTIHVVNVTRTTQSTDASSLAEIGIHTIGQLAKMPGWSLQRVLGRAVGEKLAALARNRDPREINTHRRAHSAGAQSALGKKPAEVQVFRPTLRHLADRVATRLRAKSRPGRTVRVRVRFADLRSVTRSVTLDAPISATAILAEIAEELVRTVLADHSDEKTISLLAISVAHLESHWDVQLELPLGLEDEKRRPGAKRGMARWTADRAVDKIRNRFGWEAVEYGAALGLSLSVPDEFRELAEKDL